MKDIGALPEQAPWVGVTGLTTSHTRECFHSLIRRLSVGFPQSKQLGKDTQILSRMICNSRQTRSNVNVQTQGLGRELQRAIRTPCP